MKSQQKNPEQVRKELDEILNDTKSIVAEGEAYLASIGQPIQRKSAKEHIAGFFDRLTAEEARNLKGVLVEGHFIELAAYVRMLEKQLLEHQNNPSDQQ